MIRDFKAFILRGNVIDLAIGVAIGAAFTAVITAFTKNLLTPLLAIPGDAASFSDLSFKVSGSEFRYGAVIDAIVTFLLVSSSSCAQSNPSWRVARPSPRWNRRPAIAPNA